MPNVPLLDLATGSRGERSVSDQVFGARPNGHLLYEAVRQRRAGLRRGTHATKNRALVSGGGKKPWRQKGTGRARVGSTRNPLWRKGGTVFGPQPRDYSYRLPGKVQRGALRSALSLKTREGALSVVTGFALEAPSAKKLRAQLDSLGVTASVLLVELQPSRELSLSARNLEGVELRSVNDLTTDAVLQARSVLLSEAALARLEEKLTP